MSSRGDAAVPSKVSSFLVGEGVFKLGYVTNDRDAAVERAKEELGIEKFITIDEASFEARARDGSTGAVHLRLAVWADEHTIVELSEPVGGMDEIFRQRLEGANSFRLAFHHFGVLVDDLDAAKAEAADRGLTPALESLGGGPPVTFTFMEVPLLGQYVEHFHRTPESMAFLNGIRSQLQAPAPDVSGG